MDKLSGNSLIELSVSEVRQRSNEAKFLSDLTLLFQQYTGDVPCMNCKEFEKKLDLLKQKIMEAPKTKSGYNLKRKYNGLKVHGVGMITQEGMTDKIAEKVIKNHAKGYDLFDSWPDEVAKNLVKLRADHAKSFNKPLDANQIQEQKDEEARKKNEADLKKRDEAIEKIKGLSEDKIQDKIKKYKINDTGLSIDQVAVKIYNVEK